MGVTISGAEGALRWGYRHAARLRAWTITRDDQGTWSMIGMLADVDHYAVSQQPLQVITSNGWRWLIRSLEIQDASLSAVLGPQETTHGAQQVCDTGDRTA